MGTFRSVLDQLEWITNKFKEGNVKMFCSYRVKLSIHLLFVFFNNDISLIADLDFFKIISPFLFCEVHLTNRIKEFLLLS